MAPVSRGKTGASASIETVNVDLVGDIYPAEAGHRSPAPRSDRPNAAQAAAVAMAPLAVRTATHATTLSPAGGSLGRNERRGGDGGDGGESEHCLANHGSLLVLIGCVFTSRLVRRSNDPSGSTASGFVSLKSTIS